jgi:hypothetical protein
LGAAVSAGRAEPTGLSLPQSLTYLFSRYADAGQVKEIVMSALTRRLPQRPNLQQLKKQAKELLDVYLG